MNILIGDISSYKAIVVAKYLKQIKEDNIIYTFDTRQFTNYFRTKYSDRHFILDINDEDSFHQIINEYGIDYFLPVINESIKTIISKRSNYGRCLRYLGNFNDFKVLNNKMELASLMETLHIKGPSTFRCLHDAKIPCIIKPVSASSAKGVVYIKTKEELKEATNKYVDVKKMIIQEYIDGIGVGYSVYAKNGKIEVGYGHRRLAEYPIAGGSSVYRESYNDRRMHYVAEKILERIRWTGFAMFEFKLTSDNELYLIEVNPRIWGSINQGLQNGVNYFEFITGKRFLSVAKKDYKTYLSPLIYLSFFKYIIVGKFAPLIQFLKNKKCNVPDVSLFDDLKGWISTVLRKVL